MLPFKIDLHNHHQHQQLTHHPDENENEADMLERIQRKIDCEKVLRTTLELTLAQLLHEQRTLLFSLPTPRAVDSVGSESLTDSRSRSLSVGCTSPSSSSELQGPSQASPARRERASSAAEPLTMSPNTQRRLNKDQVKLKKKRKQISNKLINLDYMLKQRSSERRDKTPSKRPRPSVVLPSGPNNSAITLSDLKAETKQSPRLFFDQEEEARSDQCPSVGSTSPRDDACTCSTSSPMSPALQQWPTSTDSSTMTSGPHHARPDLSSDPLITPSSIDVELHLNSFVAGEQSSPLLDDALDLSFLESVLMRTDEEHYDAFCNPELEAMLKMVDNDECSGAAEQDLFASSFFLDSPPLPSLM